MSDMAGPEAFISVVFEIFSMQIGRDFKKIEIALATSPIRQMADESFGCGRGRSDSRSRLLALLRIFHALICSSARPSRMKPQGTIAEPSPETRFSAATGGPFFAAVFVTWRRFCFS